MSNSQNKKNEQQNNLCTTLTEQWKKGELENDWYYIRTTNGIEKWEYIKQSHGFGYYETEWVLEVLAPVPSYEEYQQLRKFLEEFNALEVVKENEQLKLIIKRTKASGNYPGRVSAYKARIINLSEENQQLKELLKECISEIHEMAETQDNRNITIYNFLSAELLTKITNAIGEK